MIGANLGLEKKCLFPVTGRKKRVGRLVNNIFFWIIFLVKTVFYACFTMIWTWEGGKNFRVGTFLNKNLLG